MERPASVIFKCHALSFAPSIEDYSIPKKCFFSHKMAYVRLEFGQNQGLWSQNGDTMSQYLGDVLQLVKNEAFQRILAFYNL